MTIKDTQDLISAWEQRYVRDGGPTAASLGEKVSALSGATATGDMADRIAAVAWDIFALADKSGVDLTEALIDHLELKNAQLKCTEGK